MRISEIQNGLSFAGRTRARNYEARSSSPNCKMGKVDLCSFQRLCEENSVLKQAFRNACRIIAEDVFVSSQNRV